VASAVTAPLPLAAGKRVIRANGVLTIDIPPEWENTKCSQANPKCGAVGPLFWARTGCRFDALHNLAQCETGSCSGIYDCSRKNQTAAGPKAIAEWTFNDKANKGLSVPDISVVDGVNLNMDVEPLGDRTLHMPTLETWLDHSLTTCGGDLRDAANCGIGDFPLKRNQLQSFIQGSEGGDNVVACLSDCGLYKFGGRFETGPSAPCSGFRCPGEPGLSCTPDFTTDAGKRCYHFRTFCDIDIPPKPEPSI